MPQGGAGIKTDNGKIAEPMVNSCFQSGRCRRFLGLNIAPKSRRNHLSSTNKLARIYGKNLGLYLLRNLLEVQNRWWNIWEDTLIKSPLAIIKSRALTGKM